MRLFLTGVVWLEACAPGTPPADPLSATALVSPGSSRGWRTRTVGVADAGRRTGNVSVVADAGEVWVAWDDAEQDQTDDRVWLAAVPDPPRLVREADTSGRPALATDGDQIYVVTLTDRDPDGQTLDHSQLAVWILDRSTGRAHTELVDPDHQNHDHGRADAAFADGVLHVCYVVHHRSRFSDELWCRVRGVEGGWGPSRSLSGGRPGSEDHPFVLLASDGARRVALTASTDVGRAPAVVLSEGLPLEVLAPDVGHGEDLGLAERTGVLHAVWRESAPGERTWSVVHQTCSDPDLEACAPDRWEREVLAGPARIDAPDLVLTPDGLLVVVWTEDRRVRVGWTCDGTFEVETPDGEAGIESTERGQPSIAVDGVNDRVHVVYRVEDPGGDTIRIASRAMPSCP